MIADKYENFHNDPQIFVINYCPFCGTDVRKFYDRDEFVDEILNP
jgi:hypothetical protein